MDTPGNQATEACPTATSPTFHSRGPLSQRLLIALAGRPSAEAPELADYLGDIERSLATTADVLRDGDLQLTLFMLYGLFYGDVGDVEDGWEWHPVTLAARAAIEERFERELRERVQVPSLPATEAEAVAAALFRLTGKESGPSLARFIAQRATANQLVEYVIHRSVYTLKEADPHSWAIPRLTGRPKAALVEIQADEYGGGRADRMHSVIFARTMRGLGLDSRYGQYVDQVSALTLASMNMMSMFGLNRRLRGAIAGHLAAFEMTSSIPNRLIGNGFRRLGFGSDVTDYFDEHVEADAVHEQIAARDLAGCLAEDEPALLADIFFGASACLAVDGLAGQEVLAAWTSGRSSLRVPLTPLAAAASTLTPSIP
ncbi:iron-containing redox enzyme family protein [Leifsonia sp. A12D58]|uniref:iron-containing redox enzyme family protein n=1 Tax=Leifsonia sp. A12D58 TaxID=3397674 RepID=UPI0039E120BA